MANSEVDEKSPVRAPCLVKIFGENKNQKYQLNGSDGSVVNIGRYPKSHIKIESINVSRLHCVLRCEKGAWIIKDNNSQNGTYINGKRLGKKEEYILQCGDLVFLGPPSENPQAFCFDNYPEEVDHIWTSPVQENDCASSRASTQSCCESQSVQFSENLEIVKSKENSNKLNSSTLISKKNDKLTDLAEEIDVIDSFAKRVHDRMTKNSKNVENKELSIPSTSQGLSTKSNTLSLNLNAGCSASPQQNQDKDDSPSLLIIEEGGLFEDSYPFSQVLGESKSAVSKNESHSLKKVETDASNKSEIHLKDNDNNELLRTKLALLTEEIKTLERSKSSLLKEYTEVCEKNKMLDQRLAEQQKLKDDMLMCEMRVKNKFKSQIIERLEEELICNICTEVLIKPTVLDCSHTFCEHCILEWKKKKGQCPICRNQIKSMTRILALDHFIDKTLETLTPGQKEKRKELILERERRKNHPRPSPSRGRGRGRRRRRTSSYTRRARPAPTVIQLPIEESMHTTEDVIQLNNSPFLNRISSSWIPDILLSDTDNDSSVEMVDQVLQPCYNCGRYDHVHYECPGY